MFVVRGQYLSIAAFIGILFQFGCSPSKDSSVSASMFRKLPNPKVTLNDLPKILRADYEYSIEYSQSIPSNLKLGKLELIFSEDGKKTFKKITDLNPLTQIYKWRTPNADIEQATLRIVLADSRDNQSIQEKSFRIRKSNPLINAKNFNNLSSQSKSIQFTAQCSSDLVIQVTLQVSATPNGEYQTINTKQLECLNGTFTYESNELSTGFYIIQLFQDDQAGHETLVQEGPILIDRDNHPVVYHSNGATSGSVPLDTQINYRLGNSIKLLENTGNLNKLGYSFIGWSTTSEATQILENILLKPGSTYTITEKETHFYAQWGTNHYQVKYELNGGTGNVAVQSYTYNSSFQLASANHLSRVGYYFFKWKDPNGNLFDPDTPFVMPATDITLQAQWKAIIPVATQIELATQATKMRATDCTPFVANVYDSSHTQTVLTQTSRLALSATYLESGTPASVFYSDSNCTQPQSLYSWAADTPSLGFYIKTKVTQVISLKGELLDSKTLVTPITFNVSSIAGEPTAIHLSMAAGSRTTIAADGKDQTLLKALVLDTFNNPVRDETVNLNISAGGGSAQPSITNALGEATLQLVSSDISGAHFYTASAGSITSPATETVSVFFYGVVPAKLAISRIGNNAIVANGSDTFDLSVVVTDFNGNPVANTPVLLSIPANSGQANLNPVVSDSDGISNFTITTGTIKGTYTFSATAGTPPSLGIDITYLAGPVTNISLSIPENSKKVLNPNGKTNTTLSAILKDTHGNLVEGEPVTLIIPTNAGTVSNPTLRSDVAGEASWTLTSSLFSGTYAYIAKAASGAESQPVSVTFLQVPTKLDLSVVDLEPKVLANDGASKATLRATLLDELSQPILGTELTLNIPPQGGSAITAALTDTQGNADFSLTSSTTIGTYSYTVKGAGLVSNAVTIEFSECTPARVSVVGSFPSGDGSAQSPYLICSPAQLNLIGSNTTFWSKAFKLGKSIDLSTLGLTPYNKIGNSTTGFSGTFDGQFYKIQNLTIVDSTIGVLGVGLFGQLTSPAKVSNLILSISKIDAKSGNYVGGLVGQISKVGTTNVIVSKVGVIASNSGLITGFANVGGLVGGASGATINESFSKVAVAAVSATNNYSSNIGGFAGRIDNTSINDCYATGSVTSDSNSSYLASFVGYSNGPVNRSYASGAIIGGPAYAKGGFAAAVTYAADYNFFDIESTGSIQPGSNSRAIGLTSIQMKVPEYFMHLSWDFYRVWAKNPENQYPMLRWEPDAPSIPDLNSLFASGNGSQALPYLIQNATHLKNLALAMAISSAYRTAYYKLQNNIDVSSLSAPLMIGDIAHPFSGKFDGGGYTIYGLSINLPNFSMGGSPYYYGRVGLFGSNSGSIFGLKLAVNQITAPTADYVGALVGYNEGGTISKCAVTAIGTGSVQGNSAVGGFVGYSAGGGISESFSTINVSGSSNVGGFIGSANGGISNSYSTGNVEVSISGGGGFAGSGSAIKSFSTGKVGGMGTFKNGFSNTAEQSSFWDTTTSLITTSVGGMGYPSLEMQRIGIYLTAAWDFATVWIPPSDSNYPKLRWQDPSYVNPPIASLFAPGGSGTPESPYLLSTSEHLSNMGYAIQIDPAAANAAYKLTQDIDLAGKSISTIGSTAKPFAGSFNGNGKVIDNFEMNVVAGNTEIGAALFPVVNGATISNLVVKVRGMTINAAPSYNGYYGVIVGTASNQSVPYVLNKVGVMPAQGFSGTLKINITSNNAAYVGGVAGYLNGPVANGVSSGQIFSTIPIVVERYNSNITVKVGGVIGQLGGSVTASVSDLYYTGKLTTQFSALGIANYGANMVNQNSYAGGLVGELGPTSTVQKGWSGATYTGSLYMGGIAGLLIIPSTGTTTVASSFWDTTLVSGLPLYGAQSYLCCNGYISTANSLALTTAQMQIQNTFEDNGFKFSTTWVMPLTAGYPMLQFHPDAPPGPTLASYFNGNGGDGTAEHPFEINDLNQLFNFVRAMDFEGADTAYYKVTADIDLTSTEWKKPSNSITRPFKGNFDGNSKTLSNFHTSTAVGGLFGYLDQNAAVKRLSITISGDAGNPSASQQGTLAMVADGNTDIDAVTVNLISTSSRIAGTSVGGIVETLKGQAAIRNSTLTGNGYLIGANYAGGIAAQVLSKLAKIENCSVKTTGSITVNSGMVGGIVARLQGSISKSYNLSTIRVANYWSNVAGGLVAKCSNCSIAHSYARGDVTVEDKNNTPSGLIGSLEGAESVVQFVYSTGHPYSTSYPSTTYGGLVGAVSGGATSAMLTEGYWDTQTSKQSTSPAGTGKTTAQMTTLDLNGDGIIDTFSNWDSSIWSLEPGQYPTLK